MSNRHSHMEGRSSCMHKSFHSAKIERALDMGKDILSANSSPSSQHRKHTRTKKTALVEDFILNTMHNTNITCNCQMLLPKISHYLNTYLPPLKIFVVKQQNIIIIIICFPLERINTLILPDAVDFRKSNHSKLLRRDRQYFH